MNIIRLQEVLTRNAIKELLVNEEFLDCVANKLRLKREESVPSELQAALDAWGRQLRIMERLRGEDPIGREAAQALVDSFSPCRKP